MSNRERKDPQNSLVQDLFLLAKGYYVPNRFDQVRLARYICGYHVLVEGRLMEPKDVNYWLLKEFVQSGIILKDPDRLTHFMLDLNHGYFGWTERKDLSGKLEYQYNLTTGLLGVICTTQVREGDTNLMPFPLPEVDPKLVTLLEIEDKADNDNRTAA